MSRIPPVDNGVQPEPVRSFIARRGPSEAFAALANAPEVFTGWAIMVDELLDSPTFDARGRVIVGLRVARLLNSRHEMSGLIDSAGQAGLTEAQISAIVETDDLDGFDGADRMMLDVVTELCMTRRLGDASFGRARDALGVEALTELLMLINHHYGLALLVNALDADGGGR